MVARGEALPLAERAQLASHFAEASAEIAEAIAELSDGANHVRGRGSEAQLDLGYVAIECIDALVRPRRLGAHLPQLVADLSEDEQGGIRLLGAGHDR